MIIGIDHVSMASADLVEALRLFEQFGLRLTYTEDLPGEGVRSNQIDAGNTSIEILEALRDDAPVVKFLRNRGPGLHHICFRVTNLESHLNRLQQQGFRLINDAPVPGAHGCRVAFLHPAAGNGVLIELSEKIE